MTDLMYYGCLDIDCEDRTAVWRCCCYVLEIRFFSVLATFIELN